jgi:Paf1
MASSGDVKVNFKQDMVVSTRYRNDLPPPPMPPKLLDIDNGGLAQYLTTSFASGLARREEPNIEVDAEGGMPIDMIGIPGYFLGDESGAHGAPVLSTHPGLTL